MAFRSIRPPLFQLFFCRCAQLISLDGGIGRHHLVYAGVPNNLNNIIQLVFVQIRGDGLLLSHFPVNRFKMAQEFLQRFFLLQFPQVRGVGGTHVHHKKVHIRMEYPEARFIILKSPFVESAFILPNVSPNQHFSPRFSQSSHCCFHTLIVKSHPIDQGFIPSKTENSRPRIPRLGSGC